MKTLFEILNMRKNDRVAIVGCHGKTTTLFNLGRECKRRGKTLVTVSTKIRVPENLNEDETFVERLHTVPENDLVVSGDYVSRGKVIGYTDETLPEEADRFDYMVYEADGSRGLPIKAWAKREPVILKGTTKTLGILPVYALGMELSEETVFQYDLFRERYGDRKVFDYELLKSIINHGTGLFQYAKGNRYFFLNGCDTDEEMARGRELTEQLREDCKGIHFFYGSAIKERYDD